MMGKRAPIVLMLALLALPALSTAAAQDPSGVTSRAVETTLPAVAQDAEGRLFGVASSLRVTMQSPGSGDVFVSAQPLTQMDVQVSARLAVAAAREVTGVSTADKDFFFSIRTPAPIIGGPSAGGVMAVAAVALLRGDTLKDDVVMTGMINPDASIGPIGGILQKVDAAASVGADTFLVPTGQGTVLVTRQETVEQDGVTQVRTVQEEVNVAEYAESNYGIRVVEVMDLYEAMGPFTGVTYDRPQPTTNPLEDPGYREATSSLASRLIREETAEAANQTTRYEAVRDQLSSTNRQAVSQRLTEAEDLLNSARAAHGQDKHYLAASRAFQASVSLGGVDAVMGLFEGDPDDVDAYTASYIEASRAPTEAAAEAVSVEWPLSIGLLDSQAAAESRYLEASRSLEAAQASLEARNYGDALEAASFARQRAASVHWWQELGAATDRSDRTVEFDAIRAVVATYAETVSLDVGYAVLILGQSDARVQQAIAAQERARAAREAERPAAALAALVEALAETNTALVAVAGSDAVEARLDSLASSAAYEVQFAATLGSSPVLALSVLELAESARTSDPAAAYSLYSMARMTARASLDAAQVEIPAPVASPAGGDGIVVLFATPSGRLVMAVAAVAGFAVVSGIALAVAFREPQRRP